MASLKVVLLKDTDTLNKDVPLPYTYHGDKLWKIIESIMKDQHYVYEIVELYKLDFQEQESINKFLNADIVIMDVTNQERRPTFMYHKGNRESVGSVNDIVLVQGNAVENYKDIQDLKSICKIKQLIIYRYNEDKDIFCDITLQSTNLVSLKRNLKMILNEAVTHLQYELSARYLNRMEKRKNKVSDSIAESKYLWNEICNEILTEANHNYATPKLITQLMYAFRDIQDYQSMIELIRKCEKYETISGKIQNNMMISYLTAFAYSRRNENGDREKALEILDRLLKTKRTENELTNDIKCLCGRIYKDQFTESNCQNTVSLEKAIDWYQLGYNANPNIYAGINLLFLIAVKTDDLMKNNDAYKIIIQLNTLLGKKARSLKDLNDYWDVATYFELHVIQRDWTRSCQAALHMYLLNPPIWYLKSTINNLKILHRGTLLRGQQRARDDINTTVSNEAIFSFWIEFFSDAVDSYSKLTEERELPAQIPILVCDNYGKDDGVTMNSVYVEAYLQLNFQAASEHDTLVIRLLEQTKQNNPVDLVKTIDMNAIRSFIDVKRDSRSIFLYACENNESFSSVELHIYFSSAERRTAFNEKMSKYRASTNVDEQSQEFQLDFELDERGQRVILGQGTYGKVYIAFDRIDYKKFAVKEIPMRNSAYTEVLQNEIKILSGLDHKNIVRYHGSTIDTRKKPHIFQIIMEYVDGGSLSKIIAKFGPFPEASIRNYTRQILAGLKYLHENRILHRDIKSANILVNSKGEIKIVDFGTSKRLAGLHLCTEDTVGTLQYMCPEVVLVPPIGYGPEIDIWSVGCTVIEMATGKMPFHNITNNYALLFKIANEKQKPDIPPDLSDTGKDFLAKCFESPEKRPSAKDLLSHSFCKTRNGLLKQERKGCTIERTDCPIGPFDPSSRLPQDTDGKIGSYEPSPDYASQISKDDSRRSELTKVLRNNEKMQAVISQWMELIEEKSETELLNIEKIYILFSDICQYLEDGDINILENALDRICDRLQMSTDLRLDLERSFYLLIKATNNVLSSKCLFPPHVLFAFDNLIRRVSEQLVGLIRPDFKSATISMTPLTPIGDFRPRVTSVSTDNGTTDDELTQLHQQYKKLVETNREKLQKLLDIERINETELKLLLNNHSTELDDSFSSIDNSSITTDEVNYSSPCPSIASERTNGNLGTPVIKTLKRSRTLVDLEEEHERLLKRITSNRLQINELLRGQST